MPITICVEKQKRVRLTYYLPSVREITVSRTLHGTMPRSILANFRNQHDALRGTKPGSALWADCSYSVGVFYAGRFCFVDFLTTSTLTVAPLTVQFNSELHLGQDISALVLLPDFKRCLPQTGQATIIFSFNPLYLHISKWQFTIICVVDIIGLVAHISVDYIAS